VLFIENGLMKIILETDQSLCFDEFGNSVPCIDAYQDASSETNVSYPTRRIENRDDKVVDIWTGLCWQKNANLSGFPLSWNEAVEFMQEINHAETKIENNWRLPSRMELFSLISHQEINPSLPKLHPFEEVFNGYYWTQTECARLPNQAWYIHLGGGRVQRGMKHGSYMVWPVSGPKMDTYYSADRFEKKGNLTFDSITNRTWFSGKEIYQDMVSWPEALSLIRNLNKNKEAGFTDWRLPNIRELDSLIDTTQHSPAFAEGYAIDRVQEGYWSSTTSIYEPSYAWVLYTRDGAIGVGYKPNADFQILPVRG
jgi:hypothetical protein